ncbi:MAG TPA: alpha-ketoglutarate-dependent dioxygenase AlkB, partial [Kiloniellaceae bacterium]|nr:alpha-ketoglutarate-dependent dioxygenase AlkB [Kiloniellaceae bacterium]
MAGRSRAKPNSSETPEIGQRPVDPPVQNGLMNDLKVLPGFFDAEAQQRLLKAVRNVVKAAPLFTPVMPRSGRPFSVRMSNCGPLGWVSDKEGYRYQPRHPVTGKPWPAIPEMLLDVWRELAG